MSALREPFGALDGSPVERIRLGGSQGFAVSILTYGATIQSILAPDRDGELADVVLGHDEFELYRGTRGFFGATIGRYANRIAGGRFPLAGRIVTVPANDGPNALHGGAEGFDRHLFAVEEASGSRLVLSRLSPEGEEGFPGDLQVRVAYEVHDTTLTIEFAAVASAETVVNLTNHSFFNLRGQGTALEHELCVEADRFLPVSPGGIPLGDAASVADTPFDFRRLTPIGARIREAHPQIVATRGYDHNWILDGGRSSEPRLAARLFDPESGRALALSTTEPGLQVYSGNFLDGSARGKAGTTIRQGDGVCLEPQAFPDSPNRPGYPTVRLSPGQTYRHLIRMQFTTGRP